MTMPYRTCRIALSFCLCTTLASVIGCGGNDEIEFRDPATAAPKELPSELGMPSGGGREGVDRSSAPMKVQ